MDERDAMLALERPVRRDPVGYTDAAFVAWLVVERDARRDPGHRADRCLIFSSGDVVRRVWGYPAAWRQMTDAELEALSWQP